jgi:hypothetical protein
MTPAISVTGLTRRYRDNLALDQVSLEVEAGSIIGLLGRNGIGNPDVHCGGVPDEWLLPERQQVLWLGLLSFAEDDERFAGQAGRDLALEGAGLGRPGALAGH